jgi:hypothetical protein
MPPALTEIVPGSARCRFDAVVVASWLLELLEEAAENVDMAEPGRLGTLLALSAAFF